jgi:hydrogenase maturation factor
MLAELLSKIDSSDPSVRLGPAPGEDSAVIDVGGGLVAAKMDPITFATDQIGWYAVQVNANDLAATGADPRWMMATLFLPEGERASVAAEIFDQLTSAAAQLGVTLIGGHTEVTLDIPRPIVSGAMLGTVSADQIARTGGAEVDDAIILTKGIAIEGTAILAAEMASELVTAGVPQRQVDCARDFLRDPGISVVRDARIARDGFAVHAMHDPTEGGLATGLREIAGASGVGLEIDSDAVLVYAECESFCRALGMNPWGLIASGALLISLPDTEAQRCVDALDANGVGASIIGRATPPDEGLKLIAEGRERQFPEFARDEIARIFAETPD